MPELKLAQGFTFTDLYQPAGLARFDQAFLSGLDKTDSALAGRLRMARAEPGALHVRRRTHGGRRFRRG